MDKIDLTYSGKLKTLINVTTRAELDVNYTVDGKTGEPTTTSILLCGEKESFLMVTFNYQELKKLVEGEKNE